VLADGRLELIIGKGNGSAQAQLFHVTTEDQWDRNRESYELFRRSGAEPKVTWSGQFRPSLTDAEVWPRPLQQPSGCGTAAPPAASRWSWPRVSATRCSRRT